MVAKGVTKYELAFWLPHQLPSDYEALVEDRGGETGLERDDVSAGDGLRDPDVLGGDDEAVVDAVVVGLPRCAAEGDEVPRPELFKVAEGVCDAARVLVPRVADDVRVRAALVGKAGTERGA
jgi:hypothetical protein